MSKKDPYLYDDVDVLKNKGNIKDASKLNEFEEAIVPQCLIDKKTFESFCGHLPKNATIGEDPFLRG